MAYQFKVLWQSLSLWWWHSLGTIVATSQIIYWKQTMYHISSVYVTVHHANYKLIHQSSTDHKLLGGSFLMLTWSFVYCRHYNAVSFYNIYIYINMLHMELTEMKEQKPCGGRVNTLRWEEHGWHFADSIFKRIFLKKYLFDLLFQSHWNFFHGIQFFNKLTLVLLMTWHITWTDQCLCRMPMGHSELFGMLYFLTLGPISTHDDVIKWKHFSLYWPFVRGIHRSPVNSPHKGQWRGALMFSLICVWINGWVNREAGDWRGYRAHYDVILMNSTWCWLKPLAIKCVTALKSFQQVKSPV